MPTVFICAPSDLQDRLRSTLLWRTAVERVPDVDPERLLALVHERRPRLIIVDGRDAGAVELVRRVRSDEHARTVSIAALLGEGSAERESDLRQSGVNVVLSDQLNLALWDDAFQELLNVPPRRWVSFPVMATVGARTSPDHERFELTALNISIRGLLVETRQILATGTVVNLFFSLGEPPEVHLAGRIVWERAAEDGLSRQGIEFLGFHGDALGRISLFVAGAAPR